MPRFVAALAVLLVLAPLSARADDPLERVTGQEEWRERRNRPDAQEAIRIYEEALRRWALASAHMAWQRERMEQIRRRLGIVDDDPRPPPMSDADRAQRIQDVLAGRRAMRPDEFDDEGNAIDRESPLPERNR